MLVGLDIGGTKVAGVLMSDDGRVVDSGWIPHQARNAAQARSLLVEMAQKVTGGVAPEHVTDAGVSVAGLVGADGRVTRKGLLALDHDDIAGPIAEATGMRMFVSNDADATLRAVIARDADQLVSDAVLFGLGTGVAGAVMWRGVLLRGRVGLAGELGHLPVRESLGYPCVCGGSGCLEQYAGGRGLAERARITVWSGQGDALLAHAGVTAERLTAVHVVEAARAGEARATALLDDAADALAQAIVAIAVVTEPSKVYLGSSLGHAAADLLLSPIGSHLARRWPFASVISPPAIVLDNVGPTAAAVGAALLARDESSAARTY